MVYVGEEFDGEDTCFLCVEEREAIESANESEEEEIIVSQKWSPGKSTQLEQPDPYILLVPLKGSSDLALHAGGTGNLVWQFYNKPAKDFKRKLECRICKEKSTHNRATTCTLIAHVKKCHVQVLNYLEAKRTGTQPSELSTIDNSQQQITKLNAVTSCSQKLDKYYQVQSDLVYSATVLNPTLNLAYFEPVPGQEDQSTVEQVKQEVMDVFLLITRPKKKAKVSPRNCRLPAHQECLVFIEDWAVKFEILDLRNTN